MGNGSVPLITLKIKIMPSKAVLDRAEDVYQAMKKNRKNIVKRYGKEAENVMRGRAMNTAKNQVKTMNENRLKEIIKKKLSTNPKEIEEGKTGRVLGGLALFAALMAGNRALLDAEPRMAKLKTAYEQAEKAGDTARMKKIEDAITKQEIYLSTGQGEEQSIDEKKAKPEFTIAGSIEYAHLSVRYIHEVFGPFSEEEETLFIKQAKEIMKEIWE
jgi:hypothetical protein